jgi:hypothetical protein
MEGFREASFSCSVVQAADPRTKRSDSSTDGTAGRETIIRTLSGRDRKDARS